MFRIVCGGSWHITKLGNVTGEYHVEWDDACFPFDQWVDFPFDILCMWDGEMLKSFDAKEHFELFFMDGEYMLTADKRLDDGDTWLDIEAVKDFASPTRAVIGRVSVPAPLFFEETRRAAETCLAFARQNALPTTTLQDIAQRAAALCERVTRR